MRSLLLLSLPLLFSSLHVVNAIALPRSSNLKLETSDPKEGRPLLFETASARTDENNHPQPRYETHTLPIISLKHNPDPKSTDVDETHELGPTARLNIDKNDNINPSSLVQPARYLKHSRPAMKDSLREFSSQVFNALRKLSIPSFLSFSKDNSEGDTIASHSDNVTHSKDNLLEPWMIILWMIWLVPIAVVLVEMTEYAWKWIRGDVNILRSIEDEPQTWFVFANDTEKGTKDMGIRYSQPSNDDEDSDEEFNDLVP